jgi:hypothetical protein
MDYLDCDVCIATNPEDSASFVELSDIELAVAGGGCGETVFH